MFDWLTGKKEDQASGAATATEAVSDTTARSIRSEGTPLAEPNSADEEKLSTELAKEMDDCESIVKAPDFDLPMLPGVALKMMDLMQDPNVAVKDLSDLVRYDPVLSAKFLRMANSAMYGGRVTIETPDHAITRLGLREVKNMVMSVALHGTIFKDRRLGALAKEIWEHSMSCAIASQELAKKLGSSGDSVFIGGLLHDIGKVPAMLFVQRSMGDLNNVRPEFVHSLVEQHHVRAGLALVDSWSLPTEARLTMGVHHAVNTLEDAHAQIRLRLPKSTDEDIQKYEMNLAPVILADRALVSLGYAEEPGSVDIIDAPLSRELGLSPMDATQYLQNLPELLEKMPSLS